MDNIDIKIIDIIQRNANISSQDLAERVSISKSAAWRRVQQLQNQGVISQPIALVNPSAVGLQLKVYISIRTNQHNADWSKNFCDVMSQIDEVVEVSRMSGDLDYLVKAVVRDMNHYDQVYQQMIKADLTDVSASFVMEAIKETTALPLHAINI